MVELKVVVARLVAEVAQLKYAGGAAEFQIAAQQVPALPATFVLPARESAAANPFGNQLVEQTVTSEFAVLIAVRNLSDRDGAATTDALQPIRTAIRQALLNWSPDGSADGCEFVHGELLAFDANGVLWWNDFYRTAYVIRST